MSALDLILGAFAILGNLALFAGFLIERGQHRLREERADGAHMEAVKNLEEQIDDAHRRIKVLEEGHQESREAIVRFDEKLTSALGWLKRIADKLNVA